MRDFATALQKDLGAVGPDAASHLDQIDAASARMGQMIDGILTLSRGCRGHLHRISLDLSQVTRRLLDELAREQPERRVRVDIEPDLRFDGDPPMLEALLGNLLSNAWKFTARTPDACIRVYGEIQDGLRRLCVADNGAGFDRAQQQHLFQPLSRLHREVDFPGTGIGLATVRRIVQRHGGVIDAWGEPGRGPRFCLSLGHPEYRQESS